jgi:alpha-glucosidase
LASGASSSYSVYEDSGVSVEYQRGVFARTPIKASQTGDTLRVEIGPIEGSYPGMMKARSYELRLPDDWPPASVTVNGVAVKQSDVSGKGGWSFQGNTLTTIVPVASSSTATKVTVEVHRAAGLTARRGELDDFTGTMTRLRGAYDAVQQTFPFASAPDILTDAMQTGDRLSYHPEHAVAELAHLHEVLPAAQSSLSKLEPDFLERINKNSLHVSASNLSPAEQEAQKQLRTQTFRRAELLATDATK